MNGLSLRLSPFFFYTLPDWSIAFQSFFLCFNLFDMFRHCKRLIVLFPLYTPGVLGLVLVSIKLLLYTHTLCNQSKNTFGLSSPNKSLTSSLSPLFASANLGSP